MGAFFVGSMSVIGLPPTFGFVSKWHLFLGALSTGQTVFVGVLIVSSILNIAYLLPPVWKAFFPSGPTDYDEGGVKEAPWACVAPVVITSTLCFVLFFFPDQFVALTQNLFAAK
jgi:multicomponent Na+:H+ antiporter subunit D